MKQLRLSSIDDETLQLKTRKTKTERVTERLETLVPDRRCLDSSSRVTSFPADAGAAL